LITNVSQQKEYFKELKGQLPQFKKDPDEWKIINELEFNTWIDSKINGCTFEKQYLEKLKNKK
jgi:hypothetical protein